MPILPWHRSILPLQKKKMTEYVEEERSNALLKSELRVKDRVAIIGSGNWLDLRGFAVTPRASALSIIIGNNAKKYEWWRREFAGTYR